MLTETEHRLTSINSSARVHLYGQELAPESYAVCRSDMMLKGQDASNIVFGSACWPHGARPTRSHERYAKVFDLDPSPGRAFGAQLRSPD
jgi:hypothetical protein